MKIPLFTHKFMYLWNILLKHALHLHMLEVGKQAHKFLSEEEGKGIHIIAHIAGIYHRANL